MIKTLYKYPFIDKGIIRSFKHQPSNNFKYKLFSKSSFIPYFLKNKTIFIYNGNSFKWIKFTSTKLIYKWGMFIFTKKFKINK
uniref:30S ribosomal protein S19 n=1 Tax=Nephromyces sp. ex Molgula occidentalis TaxID=2544991 RepID=A0A5C1H8A7_9APIC|nr:30S ribosomal protein S19 [Nephromyces sp. ex Molgula occidentalis]